MSDSDKSRFKNVALAGITFQAGSAAVDSSTIMAALVYQLTGSSIVVGAITAILRFGWLFPQLIIGFLAQRSGSSMQYYVIGAFGRAACMALMAATLWVGADWPRGWLAVAVMVIWVAYAFISGIVAVPYNDIVARSVPSKLRSRLLATRFFGGGVLALVVVGIADRLVSNLAFPLSYAAIIAIASVLMFLSSTVFTAMGEPETKGSAADKPGFFQYLKDGVQVFRTDNRFATFVYAQWCGGAVLMAMPFYVVQASKSGVSLEYVALLLGAQTTGALLSNPLWGWWGDHLGKVSLLRAIALGRVVPPLLALSLPEGALFWFFMVVFFLMGALANGLTIAVIGFLMEISPDDKRPAYSGYFNAITAPAFLLPLLAGIIASVVGLPVVFAISLGCVSKVVEIDFRHLRAG
ncbi:MFS transporter [Profundibacter sp.]|uniref:MFS transporter n=1 Tax=Profundibacter sp. TaxID=3101071 RepID=UPI003D097DCE